MDNWINKSREEKLIERWNENKVMMDKKKWKIGWREKEGKNDNVEKGRKIDEKGWEVRKVERKSKMIIELKKKKDRGKKEEKIGNVIDEKKIEK